MLSFDFQKIAKNERFKTDFEDLGLIGSGGFAEVHKARNNHDGKLYAVKIIKLKPSPNLEETEENFYRALSEVKIHSQLHHPQILKYHGCWMELLPYSPEELAHLEEEDVPEPEFQMVIQDDSFSSDGFVFGGSQSSKPQMTATTKNEVRSKKVIGDGKRLNDYKEIRIMMLVEPCQMNLQAYIYQRSLGTGHSQQRLEAYWDSNLEMALQMTRGLNYLHSKRIIHRDIKLHNVLLNQMNQCKLIDFGLARKSKFWKSSIEERHKQKISLEEDEEMEEFSKSVGTRLFSSPQQASSERYDYRTDIFSLAMVIVLLFCSFTTTHEQRELIEVIRLRKLEGIHMPQRLRTVMYRSLGAEGERPSLGEIQNILREILRERKSGSRALPLCARKGNVQMEARSAQVLVNDGKEH